ncbi:hypothetical protein R75465_00570 [Paraburkholderia aspalathi]|nr:hypothetical protein R75465_00570 [Paraburkholderia aspalathi]
MVNVLTGTRFNAAVSIAIGPGGPRALELVVSLFMVGPVAWVAIAIAFHRW